MKKFLFLIFALILSGCHSQNEAIQQAPSYIEDQDNPLYCIQIDQNSYTPLENTSIHSYLEHQVTITKLDTFEQSELTGNLTINELGLNDNFGDVLLKYNIQPNFAMIEYLKSSNLDDLEIATFDGTLPDLSKYKSITLSLAYYFENDHWYQLDYANDSLSNHPTHTLVTYQIGGMLEENENSGKIISLSIFYKTGK